VSPTSQRVGICGERHKRLFFFFFCFLFFFSFFLSKGVHRVETATVAVTESISEPLAVLSNGVVELERIQLSCQVLRQTLRFVSLVRRLEKHLEQNQIPQAARCLVELAPLENSDSELYAIYEVQKLVPAVEAAKNSVRNKASSMLMDGMVAQAQQDVTSALLAFAALGILREKIRTAVSISSNRARRVIDAGIGADESSNPWPSLEVTTAELHELCLSVWHLQHVLVRAKDPSTGKTLWESSRLEESITHPFWVQLAAKLAGALALPARKAVHQEYPRLFRLLRDFCQKVMLSYEMLQLQSPHRIDEPVALKLLMKPLSGVALAHVGRTKRRLARGAQTLFGSSTISNQKIDDAKIAVFCKVMTKELVEARDAPPIAEDVSLEVLSGVKLVAAEIKKRMEKEIAELSVATQTPAHMTNAGYYNTMLAIEGSLKSVMFSLGRDFESNANLKAAVEVCLETEREICLPLTVAIKGNISASHAFRNAVLPLYRASRVIQEVLEDEVIVQIVSSFIASATAKSSASDGEKAHLSNQCKIFEERTLQLGCGGEKSQICVRKLRALKEIVEYVNEKEMDLVLQDVEVLEEKAINAVLNKGGSEWIQRNVQSWEEAETKMASFKEHPYYELLEKVWEKTK
jgi:hypothetical protein